MLHFRNIGLFQSHWPLPASHTVQTDRANTLLQVLPGSASLRSASAATASAAPQHPWLSPEGGGEALTDLGRWCYVRVDRKVPEALDQKSLDAQQLTEGCALSFCFSPRDPEPISLDLRIEEE